MSDKPEGTRKHRHRYDIGVIVVSCGWFWNDGGHFECKCGKRKPE